MNVTVNGIEIYYEKEGEGPPIILLHGNGEDHTIFDLLAKRLAEDHTVFLTDTRGHGKSEKLSSFHYSDMTEDIASFIRGLGIERPILYGFSDGGIVGLMLASKHQRMLSGLVVSGANLSPKDLKPSFRLFTRLLNLFKRDPLLKLMLTEPDIKDDDLRKIDVPVLITVAEKDIVSVSHAGHISGTVQDGSLAVIPKEDHASYVIHSDKLFPLISDWIAEKL